MKRTLFMDTPSLTALANDLVRIDPEGTHRIYYHGTVLALWDDERPYPITGVAEVAEVFALDGLIQLLTTDEDLGVYAQPVAPFRIEIVPPGGTPSQPVHRIPRDPAWIVDDLDEAPGGPEARTRQELIDPALIDRGWAGALLAREVSFRSAIDGTTRRVDYALSIVPAPEGRPILVGYLEAKHDGLPPEHGLEQARLYAEGRRAHIRWVFSTNGHAFVQFDRLTQARSGPFPLAAFPTPQELAARYQPGQAIDPPILAPDLRHPDSTRLIDRNDPQVSGSCCYPSAIPSCGCWPSRSSTPMPSTPPAGP